MDNSGAAGRIAEAAGYAATPAYVPPADAPPTGTNPAIKSNLSALGGGLAAGERAPVASDSTSAGISIGEGALSGAATGFIASGFNPMGAVIGGGAGLLTSGLNAWLSVGAENKRKSETAALLAEAQTRQDAQDRQKRQDAVEQLGYDRAATERANTEATNTLLHNRLTETIAGSAALRDKYLKSGITSGRV